jgi:mono/diheme cytochrome c family protein
MAKRGLMRALKTLLVALLLCSFGASAQTVPSSKADTSTAGVENGKRVFARVGCVGCHGDRGQGTNVGPQIASPDLDQVTLMRFVRQPSGSMPAFSADVVSDKELADVFAYIHSVAVTKPAGFLLSGDAAKGKKLFISYGCYECHGTEGQGAITGARIGPPAISQSVFTQYVHHPTGQMPPYTDKVASGQDLADIYSFLKSIPPPAPAASIPLLNQ